ncbi:hypothetical protein AB0N14_17900 [Streptomyces sp. NPDC051104]|uniref:hypothetical protein n=1 Tax=Streptomyces sp. NPDC051104 TaxID=3155044 RepID=UPI00342206B5
MADPAFGSKVAVARYGRVAWLCGLVKRIAAGLTSFTDGVAGRWGAEACRDAECTASALAVPAEAMSVPAATKTAHLDLPRRLVRRFPPRMDIG